MSERRSGDQLDLVLLGFKGLLKLECDVMNAMMNAIISFVQIPNVHSLWKEHLNRNS